MVYDTQDRHPHQLQVQNRFLIRTAMKEQGVRVKQPQNGVVLAHSGQALA